MIIPEQLWIPSAKDALAQFAPQRVARRNNVSSALASNSVDLYQVPSDFVFLLGQVTLSAATAGVTTINSIFVGMLDEQFQFLHNILHDSFASDGIAATATYRKHREVEIVLMPREIVRFEAFYTAGAAGNQLESTLTGVLIPRGNWQLG